MRDKLNITIDMKVIRQTLLLTGIIFLALTLLTMVKEAASDGIDTYGFPYTFYDHFEGKCNNCYDKFGFKPVYFIIDLLGTTALSFFVILIKNRLKKEEPGNE